MGGDSGGGMGGKRKKIWVGSGDWGGGLGGTGVETVVVPEKVGTGRRDGWGQEGGMGRDREEGLMIYIYIYIFDPKQNEFVCIVGAWK